MSNDKLKQVQSYFDPQYDSDEDLEAEQQKKIKQQENQFNYSGAEKTRKESWEKADVYPKIKRFVKGAWYGDKRKPKDE
jgi:hypothetical protein